MVSILEPPNPRYYQPTVLPEAPEIIESKIPKAWVKPRKRNLDRKPKNLKNISSMNEIMSYISRKQQLKSFKQTTAELQNIRKQIERNKYKYNLYNKQKREYERNIKIRKQQQIKDFQNRKYLEKKQKILLRHNYDSTKSLINNYAKLPPIKPKSHIRISEKKYESSVNIDKKKAPKHIPKHTSKRNISSDMSLVLNHSNIKQLKLSKSTNQLLLLKKKNLSSFNPFEWDPETQIKLCRSQSITNIGFNFPMKKQNSFLKRNSNQFHPLTWNEIDNKVY